MMFANRKCLWLIPLAILLLAYLVHVVSERATPKERYLRQELENLPAGTAVPLSDLAPLKGFERVCIVDSYAIHPPHEDKSLSQIFGPIDYSKYREDIVKKYSDYYGMGFFPVRANQLVEWIRVGASPKAHIMPGKVASNGKFEYFRLSGCYGTSDVCLTQVGRDKYGDRIVEINFCQQPAGRP